jgi:hypothetical protein
MACCARPRWATLLMLAAAVGCAPVNVSDHEVVGAWREEWECGVETLVFESDGTYTYTVEFAVGGRATDSGQWKIIPKTDFLEGAHVVLKNALDLCSPFGEKVTEPQREDLPLVASWEYGRLTLSYDPDSAGFTRIRIPR